jgi:hypothetical protein
VAFESFRILAAPTVVFRCGSNRPRQLILTVTYG